MSGIYELPPKSNQEAFDRVWQTFVINQQPRAMNGTTCVYRTPVGTGCAIGCQLPQALYHSQLEHGAPVRVIMGWQKNNSGTPDQVLVGIREHFKRVAPALLVALQTAHDSSSEIVGMERELRAVAAEWNLHVLAGA